MTPFLSREDLKSLETFVDMSNGADRLLFRTTPARPPPPLSVPSHNTSYGQEGRVRVEWGASKAIKLPNKTVDDAVSRT